MQILICLKIGRNDKKTKEYGLIKTDLPKQKIEDKKS